MIGPVLDIRASHELHTSMNETVDNHEVAVTESNEWVQDFY